VTSDNEHAWKEIGWDGFRVTVPSRWDPGRIGRNYLLLEDDGNPVFEAKWDFVKGRFSPENCLGKLKRAIPKGRTIRPWEVPRTWSEAVVPFESAGFQWQGDLFSGKGAILFCGDCGRATLLQFYERKKGNSRPSQANRPKILSSFGDHPVDGKTLWSIFDMRLELPRHFALVDHSFAPGAFELRFDAGACKTSFHRWSPASIILSGKNLDAFARSAFSLGTDDTFSKRESDDSKTIEFQSLPPLSRFRASWMKLRGKLLYIWARMWYVPSVNRILGVKAQSAEPLDVEYLREICGRYEIVQDARRST
jgi:hypothetical protein